MDIVTVARKAGVSTATVSRVINGTRRVSEPIAQRVRSAIEALNYIPNNHARSLRSGRSNLIGILISDVRNPFFPDVIEHFEALATQQGFDVVFANSGYNEQRLMNNLRRLLDRGVDGIAVLTSEVSSEVIHSLRNVDIPVVFLNQPLVDGKFQNIAIDYCRGVREALAHLQMLGHERIAFVSGPAILASAMRRRISFLSVMKECGLNIKDEWILEGDHKLTGGKLAAARLFTMPSPPTAVVCSNDLTAIGFLHAANRLNRSVPEDLSVIGFDDIAMSEVVQPSLTTQHLSRREIATHAFFALRNHEGNGRPGSTVLLPQLVIRESTGTAPKI
jgi:LacI family transcriptional regulator